MVIPARQNFLLQCHLVGKLSSYQEEVSCRAFRGDLSLGMAGAVAVLFHVVFLSL